MPAKPDKHRISISTIVLMGAVALLFDGIIAAPKLLDLIPYLNILTAPVNFMVGMLVSVWAWLTFYVWFKLHGITFLGIKRIAAFPIAFLIKLIPFFGMLPAWTTAVLVLFATTRAEELLEKAGPLGTIASKALAAQTQGGLSLARSQKSEKERANNEKKKKGGLGEENQSGAGNVAQGQPGQGAATTPPKTPREKPYEKGKAYIDAGRDYIRKDLGKGGGDRRENTNPSPPQNAPKQDIGAQPVFRQTPPQTPPKTPREKPYEKGKAYIDAGRDYIGRKDFGKKEGGLGKKT